MTDAYVTPAGRTAGVAVVGVGYWGRNLARNFAELGALAAIVDSNAEQAALIAGQTNARVLTLEEALADDAVHGVAIATRAETHAAIARQVIAAKRHVFVEKPLVLDMGEADELIAAAEDAGVTLMVGHLLRYHPVFQRMLEIVGSGELGRLRYVYSDRMSLGKIRTEEDVLWSFSPHDISMVLALAGGRSPTEVTAQGAAIVQSGIADIATLQLAFADGLKADIRASWLHYRKVQQIVAICEQGTVVFEDSAADWSRKLMVHPHRIAPDPAGIPVPARGEAYPVKVDQAEPLKAECAHFLGCIAGSHPARTDGAEGRSVLDVLQRASNAMETNR